MVKKLFKHEILAFWRGWSLIQIALLATALFGRFIQLFENNTAVYDIVFGSTTFAYSILIMVAFVGTLFSGVTRFYKNLFTSEGYLTHTLPVTATQHIMVKLVTAVLFQIATLFVVLASACIITAGDVLVEVVKAIGYLIGEIYEYTGAHMVLYIVEIIVVTIVSLFSSFLVYYTCICLGQLSKKNRVLVSVGIYFGMSMVGQVVSTVLMTFTTFPVFEDIVMYFTDHPITAIHISLCLGIVITLILSIVFFIICRMVMKKKLNLE
ncbi:MAG: hypothetical protein IJF54_00505 [Clostridia bacterium]|nr:hypothetical protein [Clostridia bacterium]